jgi:hypothetical protein
MIKKVAFVLVLTMLFGLVAVAANESPQQSAVDQVVDRIAVRETEAVKALERYSPLLETYVQTFTPDKDLGRVPRGDHYFLGRVSFRGRIRDEDFLLESGQSFTHRLMRQVTDLSIRQHRTGWAPLGFASMAVIDPVAFNRSSYTFKFLRREFLGEVRCLVFDVVPKSHSGRGRFLGRIWVEDRDYNVVRFNGTYVRPKASTTYVHFDSWRVNVAGHGWLPAYIYGEESAVRIDGKTVALKSQSRLWGYAASDRDRVQQEFTVVLVDGKDGVTDQSETSALSPLASQRAFEREAENNVLDRLESSGLLAPRSPVDKILETVVNNLMVTNNLTVEPEVRCRVLLTTPIESLTVGHTIVVSRGLLDVLPDEAALAAVVARELGHIILAHALDTKFAFGDRMLFADPETISRLAMLRPADQEAEADKKAMELLATSPYKEKLAGAGLFMQQLRGVQPVLPNLVRGRMGCSLVASGAAHLGGILESAPKLDRLDIHQVAALPLGSRIAIDPWSNRAELSKAKNVAVASAREKMPFQVTPFYPYLLRKDASGAEADAAKLSNLGGVD